MERLLLHSIFALLTFVVGVYLVAWCKFYNEKVFLEQEAKRNETYRAVPYTPPIGAESVTPANPNSFAAELERIDKMYKQRCSVPSEAESRGLPHIEDAIMASKALRKLSDCTDEWAIARRAAIKAQGRKFLVIY